MDEQFFLVKFVFKELVFFVEDVLVILLIVCMQEFVILVEEFDIEKVEVLEVLMM